MAAALLATACTGAHDAPAANPALPNTAGSTNAPPGTSPVPGPHSASPSPAATPQPEQYAEDVAYSPALGTWLLGSTCNDVCTSWVRPLVGRTFPRGRQQTVGSVPAAADDRPQELTADGHTLTVSSARSHIVSTDEGRTWHQHPAGPEPTPTSVANAPCNGLFTTVRHSGRYVWFLCQDETPPALPVHVYLSRDGGRTWQHRPDAPALRYRAQLQTVGQQAFLSCGKTPLYETDDAGLTWHEALPFRDEEGYGPVVTEKPGTVYVVLNRRVDWNGFAGAVVRRVGHGWERLTVPA